MWSSLLILLILIAATLVAQTTKVKLTPITKGRAIQSAAFQRANSLERWVVLAGFIAVGLFCIINNPRTIDGLYYFLLIILFIGLISKLVAVVFGFRWRKIYYLTFLGALWRAAAWSVLYFYSTNPTFVYALAGFYLGYQCFLIYLNKVPTKTTTTT